VVLVLVVAVAALAVAAATDRSRLTQVRVRAVRLLAAAAVIQVGTSVLAPGSGAARVTSLNWGAWDSGMVSPEVKAVFAERGLVLIPSETGAQ